MSLFLGTGGAIARVALDASMLRHQTIASNIANVDTPGYIPLRVNFEEQLAAVSNNQSDNLSPRVAPFVEKDHPGSGLTPGVALDMELVKLNMNTLHYNALLRATSRYMSISSIALSEGRK